MKFSIFELRIFSFTSYIYYLTRGFIVSTRTFNLVTRAFNLLARGFEFVTRRFELVTCRFELVIHEFELVTRELELVTRGFELVTRRFELVTRVLPFHLEYSKWFKNLKFRIYVFAKCKINCSQILHGIAVLKKNTRSRVAFQTCSQNTVFSPKISSESGEFEKTTENNLNLKRNHIG